MLCPISPSHLSSISLTILGFLVISSLDCYFRFPLPHCRPGGTGSGEERAPSILPLAPKFLICIEEGVTCLWGTSASGPCAQCPSLHMFTRQCSLSVHLYNYRAHASSSFSPCSKKAIKDHVCVLWRPLANEDHYPICFWDRPSIVPPCRHL